MPTLNRYKHLLLPVCLIASILVILVPLPSAIMDLLLGANITISVLILLTTVMVKTPLEFAVFPTLLLVTTLARLVLNVATTRLILTGAEERGIQAAGGIVEGFGQFVAGNNIVVGAVIFIVMVLIQFLVIAKGATRISEVAARFALDGLPGRQMAIDADLANGAIDQAEASRRRQEVSARADFYGSMDGASKFVVGDAIAGMCITVVNIVGGLLIGVLQAGMDLSEAASLFTKLTIGDGLVSQVPALLISIAAGVLITRSTEKSDLGNDVVDQLLARPEALFGAAILLVILIFTGLPAVPLLALSLGCVGVAVMIAPHLVEQAPPTTQKRFTKETKKEKKPEDHLSIDPLALEIGVRLIALADPHRGGDLLERVAELRTQTAREAGILLPKLRIRDNMRLDENAYRIKLFDDVIATGGCYHNRLLAIADQPGAVCPEGTPSQDPLTGKPAAWISPPERASAESLGCLVVDPTTMIVRHLEQVIRDLGHELLTRDATSFLLEQAKQTSPAVVEELVPELLTVGHIQGVLKRLLRQQVSIRQLPTILEILCDAARHTTNLVLLTELVRQGMARSICRSLANEALVLSVAKLDADVESYLERHQSMDQPEDTTRLDPKVRTQLKQQLESLAAQMIQQRTSPVLLVASSIRPLVQQLTPQLPIPLLVLGDREIADGIRVRVTATLAANDVLGLEINEPEVSQEVA